MISSTVCLTLTERAHLQMDKAGHFQFDYALLVLVCMITAVVVACWLCVLAYSSVIPAILGGTY